MKNEVYCSTGAVVGRVTGYDHSVIKNELPAVCREAGINGIEYLFMPVTYSMTDEVKRIISASGLDCKVIHADKNIGVLLSKGGEENRAEALRLWEINCRETESLGAERIVLHLWGASESDTHFEENNLSVMPMISETAQKHGIELMIENIPCVTKDPLSRFSELEPYGCNFIYDVRFGQLHRQNYELANSDYVKNGRISHIHISDTDCEYLEYGRIRPILHPTEGKIDFSMIFGSLKNADYKGTFTLESPVMSESGVDMKKLSKTLSWLRNEADKL